jgi:hypothetical protein
VSTLRICGVILSLSLDCMLFEDKASSSLQGKSNWSREDRQKSLYTPGATQAVLDSNTKDKTASLSHPAPSRFVPEEFHASGFDDT